MFNVELKGSQIMTGTTARGNITDVLLSCMCNVKTLKFFYVWTKMKLKYSPQLFKGGIALSTG